MEELGARSQMSFADLTHWCHTVSMSERRERHAYPETTRSLFDPTVKRQLQEMASQTFRIISAAIWNDQHPYGPFYHEREEEKRAEEKL